MVCCNVAVSLRWVAATAVLAAEGIWLSISYDAPDRAGEKLVIDAAYVDEQLGKLVQDEDLSRYIL